jgi:predicted nucleic acid-binding protein
VAGPAYLIDTSALTRAEKPAVGARLAPMIETGSLATCSVTDLELLFGARSGQDHGARRADLELRFARVPIDQRTLDRAVDVQGLLANKGQHRGASVPDLVIAAAAERAGLAVLHYDADFDLIASVTGQPVEWVVPRGSID